MLLIPSDTIRTNGRDLERWFFGREVALELSVVKWVQSSSILPEPIRRGATYRRDHRDGYRNPTSREAE